MKQLFSTIVLFITLGLASLQAATRAEQIRSDLENGSVNKVFVVAHRAAWKKAPENSRLAVEHAIEMGVDIVEIDIRRTKDGVFVLMHDESIDRTTNGRGQVSAFTYEELSKLKLKDADGNVTEHTIPTLEEILLMAKGKVLINLDKADGHFKELLPLMRKTGSIKDVMLKGYYSEKELIRLLGNDFEGIYMPMVSLRWQSKQLAQQEGALDVNAVYPLFKGTNAVETKFKELTDKVISKEVLAQLKEKNVRTWINTLMVSHSAGLNDQKALKDPDSVWGVLIDQGFSIIQTDEPEILLSYLREKGHHE